MDVELLQSVQLQDGNSSAPMYTKRDGTSTIFGQCNLATNVDGAGLFDDVVLQYTENGKDKWIFLQCKHRDAPKLTLDTSEKGNLSLTKCLKSFLSLKMNLHNGCFTVLNGTELNDNVELILFTTAEVDVNVDGKLKLDRVDVSPNNLLSFASSKGSSSILRGSLESLKTAASEWYRESLAEIIAKKYICENNQTELEEYVSSLLKSINKTSLKLLFHHFDIVNTDHTKLKKNINAITEFLNKAHRSYMLSDKDSSELVIDFLNKFRIYAKQYTESKIEDVLKEEIGTVLKEEIRTDSSKAEIIFLIFHDLVQEWWSKKGNVPWQTKNSTLFRDAMSKTNCPTVQNLDQISRYKLMVFNIEFCLDRIDSTLKERLDLVVESQNDIVLNIESSNHALSCLKIVQYLQSKSFEFIYLDSKLVEAFSVDLLISVNCIVFSYERSLSTGIIQSLKQFVHKIIFVTEKSCSQYDSLTDINKGLVDLTKESQGAILDRNVNFQGTCVSLRSLIGESIEVVDENTLFMLLKDGTFQIGSSNHSIQKDATDFYVERTLLRYALRRDILKDKSFSVTKSESGAISDYSKDILVVGFDMDSSNNLTKEKHNAKILSFGDAQNIYNFLCLIRPDQNIHLLKQVNIQNNQNGPLRLDRSKIVLTWETSQNSVVNLRTHKDPGLETDLKPILETNNNFVLLAAEPGMGKSSFLTALHGKIKLDCPSNWVVRINLLEHSETFQKWQEGNVRIDEQLAFQFLSNVALAETLFDDKLSKFMMAVFKQSTIVLLVDGFDEISLYYKEIVLALLKIFKMSKKIVKPIWVTSRSGPVLEQLEKELVTLAYGLQPFSEKNLIEFCSKFWSFKANTMDETCSTLIEDFNDSLMALDSNEKSFISVPLHIDMVLNLHLNRLQNSVENASSKPKDSFLYFNLLDLFEEMVKMIFYRLHRDKQKIDTAKQGNKQLLKSAWQICIEKHQTLAMALLFDIREGKYEEFLEEVKSGEEINGIIFKVIDGKPIFIHQTYAEYFCALFIFEKFSRTNSLENTFQTFSKIDNGNICKFMQLLMLKYTNKIRALEHKSEFTLEHILKDEKIFGECAILYLLQLVECSIEAVSTPLYLESMVKQVSQRSKELFLLVVCKFGFVKLAQIILKLIELNDGALLPFNGAAFNGHAEILPLFFEKYVTFNFFGRTKETLLSDEMFVKINNIPLYALWLGFSALHLSALEGHTKVVDLLLIKGAIVDAADCMGGSTPLIVASHNGHKNVVKILLDKEANVNLPTEEGATPLYLAAQNGHTKVVDLLLTRGAIANGSKLENGRTPLIQATQNGHKDVVEILLDNGANVNSSDIYGNTSLDLATHLGYTEVVALLLARAAKVDAVDDNGWTPLMQASQSGHNDVVRILLDNDANINASAKDGRTPLYIAAVNGHTEVVALLLARGAEVNAAESKHGRSAVIQATEVGHLDVVKLLIENGANVNSSDYKGVTPLYAAARDGYTEILAFLLEKGAIVDQIENDQSSTPLMVASRYGHKSAVQLLLEYGANINRVSKTYGTPLYYAAEHGHTEVVSLLLSRGATVNAGSVDGWTPLMVASYYGHPHVVQMLLANEADINFRTKEGATSLYLAAQNGNEEMVYLLAAYGAIVDVADVEDGYTPLIVASLRNHKEMVRILLNSNANVNLTAKDDKTALYLAVKNGHTEVVELLLERGANVNASTKNGVTALHVAAEKGYTKSVAMLLARGATVDAVEKVYGRTALMQATQERHMDVLQLLLDSKANVNSSGKYGETSLYVAAADGNTEVVALLLARGAKVDAALNMNGLTPLLVASKKGHKEVVRVLLENDAKVDFSLQNGVTSLYLAAQNGNTEVVALLLARGVKVDVTNSDNGYTPLIQASENGHKAVVQLLLENKANVNSSTRNGVTSLHRAAQNGHTEVVNLLLARAAEVGKIVCSWRPLLLASQNGHRDVVEKMLDYKADVNSSTKNGVTSLYLAAQNGHTDVVTLLLTRGANVNAVKSENGRTALTQASQQGHKDIVQLLLDNGANVNSSTKDGVTSLHYAAQNGHTKVVDLLLARGAKIDAADKVFGSTPLIMASQQGHSTIVQILLEKQAHVKSSTKTGVTPLYLAAQNGHTKVVALLLEKGAEVDAAKIDNCRTPLIAATQNRHEGVVEMLLDYGANINHSAKDGVTALFMAAHNGHSEMVALLLARNARVDAAKLDNGFTPLIQASKNGHTDVVKKLLENRANVNFSSKHGVTALYYAAQNGHTEVVALLISKGAIVDTAATVGGWTPLMVASRQGHLQVVQILLEKGAEANFPTKECVTSLYLAAQNGNDEMVYLLVAYGAIVDVVNLANGCTPLIIASQSNHKDVVRILLECNANVNSSAKDNITSLYLAAQNGHTEVVKLLLDKGANVDVARKVTGYTPLLVASHNGHKAVVQLLLDYGANVNFTAKNGLRPLDVAVHHGYTELVDFLVTKGAVGGSSTLS